MSPKKGVDAVIDDDFIFVDNNPNQYYAISKSSLDFSVVKDYESLMYALIDQYGSGGHLAVINGDKLVNIDKLTRNHGFDLRYDQISHIWYDNLIRIPNMKLVYVFLGQKPDIPYGAV